jgi:hypothetical protein
MVRLLAVICLVCALLTRALAAQEPSTSSSASLIRMTSADVRSPRIIGTPLSMRADTIELVVRGSRDTLAVATSSLRRVERMIGRRGFVRRGRTAALVAGSVGAVLGLIGGGIQDSDAVSVPGGVLAGAAAGGIVGMLVGGTLADGEVWREVPGAAQRAER